MKVKSLLAAIPKGPKLSLTNHTPVAAGFFATSAAGLVIAYAKAKFGVDLTVPGYEVQLSAVIGVVVGALTKGALK